NSRRIVRIHTGRCGYDGCGLVDGRRLRLRGTALSYSADGLDTVQDPSLHRGHTQQLLGIDSPKRRIAGTHNILPGSTALRRVQGRGRLIPFAVAFVSLGPLSGYLSDKYGSRGFTTAGLSISTVGLVGLSF